MVTSVSEELADFIIGAKYGDSSRILILTSVKTSGFIS
jgi:hypothetical protein